MKLLTPQQVNQLQNMLAAAKQSQRSGLHAQAEDLYRSILKQAPQAWDVHHTLAMLLATTGRPQEAVRHFRLIVKANPTRATGHANLANALSESGSLDEAITEFRRALALDASLFGARIALGETLRRAKRFDEAIASYQTLLDADRINHAALNGLGLIYRDLGNMPLAIECFQHAAELAQNNAEYRMNFAIALRRYGLVEQAAEQFYKAIMLKPDWLEAVVLLAEVLHQQRRFDEARECYERAMRIQPGNAELHEHIGYVYLDMGDAERALNEFGKVVAQHPERYMALLGLGRSHMLAGRSSEAVKALETLVRGYPEDYRGYFYLAESRKFNADDPVIPQLQTLADKTADRQRGAIELNFALGKIYDDCGQWDDAWRHYARGNRLRNAQYDYQPARLEARYGELISLFTHEFMRAHRDLGVQDDLPVFIVGMPRSGTTLTEQIISSHPGVIGAGEVNFWASAWEAVPYTLGTDRPYPECMALMTPDKASEIADRYTGILRKIAGPGTAPARVTDKLPHNFMQLGLIALIFPNAPIIHCKRNAMDNCLSIFFHTFEGEHDYAYDLANIGQHYQQYERLMAHWHDVLPGRIFDISYEDIVADPDYWSRRLIEHVGLEWDDACLAPHKLERTVRTASHWQVRQSIYSTSVQRWKNYEKHLGPLKEALGYLGKP